MSKIKIDFAIVGNPKSGTTALAHFLSQHPEVCMSKPKEPNYFATDHIQESDAWHGKQKYFPIRTQQQYAKCYDHKKLGQKLGEASPRYLHSKAAAGNIFEHNPQAKIIIMLRHPVDFMYSNHRQLVNSCIEDEDDFATALRLENRRKEGQAIPKGALYPSHFFYTEKAKYYPLVKRYFDIFPKKNILVLTNEEFKDDNAKVFQKVLKFLDVDDATFSPAFTMINSSKAPRSKIFNKLFNHPGLRRLLHKTLGPSLYSKLSNTGRSIALKDQPRDKLSPTLKKELESQFVEDLHKTSELTNRKLASEWGIDN